MKGELTVRGRVTPEPLARPVRFTKAAFPDYHARRTGEVRTPWKSLVMNMGETRR